MQKEVITTGVRDFSRPHTLDSVLQLEPEGVNRVDTVGGVKTLLLVNDTEHVQEEFLSILAEEWEEKEGEGEEEGEEGREELKRHSGERSL